MKRISPRNREEGLILLALRVGLQPYDITTAFLHEFDKTMQEMKIVNLDRTETIREVLVRRFGLDDKGGATLRELTIEFKHSTEWVRIQEARGLRVLRNIFRDRCHTFDPVVNMALSMYGQLKFGEDFWGQAHGWRK